MAGLRKNMEKLVKYANTIIESGEFDTQPYRMSDTAWQKRARFPNGIVRLGKGENPLELESKYVRRNQ